MLKALKKIWEYIDIHKKLAILVSLSLILLIALYFLIIPSEDKALREARALALISEYKEAAEAYKKFLIKNPDNLQAKLELVNIYEKLRDFDKATDLARNVRMQAIGKNNSEMEDKALYTFRNICKMAADIYSDSAKKELEDFHYKTARDIYKLEFNLRKDVVYTYSDLIVGKKNAEDDKKYSKSSKIDKFFASYNLFEAAANIALTYWLAGEQDAAREELKNYFIETLFGRMDRDTVSQLSVPDLYQSFGDKLFALASKELEKKNYKKARDHYTGTIDAYLAAGKSISDAEISDLRYNVAITFWNEGKFGVASESLKQIKKDAPNYDIEAIGGMIKKGQILSFITAADEYFDLGIKSMKDKKYWRAIDYFRKASSYYVKGGLREKDENVCDCRFNIALSYLGLEEKGTAVEILKELIQINPDYNREQIESLAKTFNLLL